MLYKSDYKPDWNYVLLISTQIKYIARDLCGDWHGFKTKPEINTDENCWDCTNGVKQIIYRAPLFEIDYLDWNTSLERKPSLISSYPKINIESYINDNIAIGSKLICFNGEIATILSWKYRENTFKATIEGGFKYYNATRVDYQGCYYISDGRFCNWVDMQILHCIQSVFIPA